ncbi:AP-1 complex subunit gamma-2 isoform X3 [Vigna radiata var. radiata]|uniref:AP-1 complex subunit gamma n=1 Tax=Vigna radiata var. radiata TaxID=3916 RepID=A0A1S3W000_VIGRR|nr:AP-1 complex subunit gamma-2 isoform X3 [Vigna radiata var. radiata]
MFNQPSPPFIYFFLFRFLFTKFIYRNVGIAHCITVVASEWKKEKERERKFRGSHQTVLSDPNLFSLSDRNPIKLVPLDLPIMNAFSSPTRLRDMIRAIRACKTAAEERAVVRKECAAIRTSINGNDQHYSHRNLAKLMFIHMLGYPTYFGQMECLKLIACPGFPEKRMGYLGLMLLLDEKQEVLMLVTNSLKQDLNHTNQYIVGLALCALGNICSAEMARDLAEEVERLLDFRDPNIRKKAALCSARIIKKAPDLAENFVGPATALLREKHHGVLITGVQLCTDLCKINSEALEHVRKKCTDGLVRVLKDLANNPYSPEYDVAGFTDPFLHIRLLRLLRVLGEGDPDASDSMNDILAQVATKIESNKTIGNAILYECVQTIMSIQDSGGLRVLAINILGKFLSHRDNNIRYVGLNMLLKVVTADVQAVQRHRATILECIKDSDVSIRRRALELVCILVNENNVKALTKELVDYLEVSDPDFRVDLTEKICSIVSKYSSEKIWYIDQMLKVLSEAGNYVKDEVWHALIVVISNASELHGYTVRALYKAFQRSAEQDTLARVAMWCIGEYGEFLINNDGMLDVEDPITVTESDVVHVVEIALKRHSLDITTKAMTLVALLKLSSRFPSCSERIREIIVQYKGNFVLELQQRSIEFNLIMAKHQNIRPTLVERMPVLDEATFIARRAGSLPDAASTPTNGVAKAVAPIVDLLDINSDDAPIPSSSGGGDLSHDLLGVNISLAAQKSDVLLDLLSIGSPSAPNELPAQSNSSTIDILSSKPSKKAPLSPLDDLASLSPSSRTTLNAGASPLVDSLDGFVPSPLTGENNELVYPSITAFESSSLRLVFNFSKQPGNLQTTNIQATFTNLTSNVYTDFVFQAAVPKFLQLHLNPASGNILTASGKESITQNMRLTNSQHGKKSLVMRIKVSYKINGKETLEVGQINNFPREL